MNRLNDHFTQRINALGAARRPFLLLVDFEMEQPALFPLDELNAQQLQFQFNGMGNIPESVPPKTPTLQWATEYVPLETYTRAFNMVQQGLQRGDSFLVNLTFPTAVHCNWEDYAIFRHTKAPYKLWWKDKLVVFSPETFVRITEDGQISTHPMKGTLPGHLPVDVLLQNPKEIAEHATVVDLLRNDLSQVARQVHVQNYRYASLINTSRGAIWQTSTHIVGQLGADFPHRLGDILQQLLPAGSISGAPKPSTVRIIQQAEGQKRGFYTGIAALWNGTTLDSCVLIRLLDTRSKNWRYWSGGGITANSIAAEEYKELQEKVYLPL